jgi:hypothetical protein
MMYLGLGGLRDGHAWIISLNIFLLYPPSIVFIIPTTYGFQLSSCGSRSTRRPLASCRNPPMYALQLVATEVHPPVRLTPTNPSRFSFFCPYRTGPIECGSRCVLRRYVAGLRLSCSLGSSTATTNSRPTLPLGQPRYSRQHFRPLA